MTALTASSAFIVILGLLTLLGMPRALALGGATPMGAALLLGPTVAVPTFYFVAVFAAVFFVLSALKAPDRDGPRDRYPIPGVTLLILFALWTTCITLAAPQLFRGTLVLDSKAQPYPLSGTGLLSLSNIAQLGYLFLGVMVVVLLARSPRTGIGAVGIVLAVSMLLSFWRLLYLDFGLPFPVDLFDNSPAFGYVDGGARGEPRFRGIFSEPSLLSTVALATIAFFVSLLPRVRGWKRAGAILVLVATAWCAAVSNAATIVVAAPALLLVAGISVVSGIVLHQRRVPVPLIAAACLAGIGLVFVLPIILGFVQTAVDSKVSSSSYVDRSGADNFSYALVLQTFGLGVGLGSNRPSSFLAALASTTGLIGLLLFVGAVWQILRSALKVPAVRPVVWALVSLLISKVISSPDLADPTGLTWLSLGVLANAAVSTRMAERDDLEARIARERRRRRVREALSW